MDGGQECPSICTIAEMSYTMEQIVVNGQLITIENTDEAINREIAEKNEQLKAYQIRHNREQAERLNNTRK